MTGGTEELTLPAPPRRLVYRIRAWLRGVIGLDRAIVFTVLARFWSVFRFFYPRLTRGGYFFMHDYNSLESQRAVSRAAHAYMIDKPELLIEIPDYFGTALFRKI